MNINLTKKGLILVLKGFSPGYNVMNHPPYSLLGRYIGRFVDDWQWDTNKLKDLSEEDIWSLIKILDLDHPWVLK